MGRRVIGDMLRTVIRTGCSLLFCGPLVWKCPESGDVNADFAGLTPGWQVPMECASMKTFFFSAILAAAIASSASAANLLVNPGFEVAIADGVAPFTGRWQPFNAGGATAMNTAMMPRTGAQALTLSISNTANTYAGAFQDVSILGGAEYSFSGWNASPSSPLQLIAEARIEWRDATNEVGRTPNLKPVPGAAYSSFSFNATAPAGATIARVVYAIQSFDTSPNGNGVVHIDDLSFDAVPEPSSLGLLVVGALALTRRRRA